MKENFLKRMFGNKGKISNMVVDLGEQINTISVQDAPSSNPTSIIYTAEDVHRDLTAFILLYLSDIQEEIERKEVPAEIAKDAALLEKFGFTNTANAKIVNNVKSEVASHNKEYIRKKTQLAFMQEVWKKFGKDAMVVRYDHFFQILEKYDMVCESFDRYTGTIPKEALETLARIDAMDDLYNSPYSICAGFPKYQMVRAEISNRDLINFARMPFEVGGKYSSINDELPSRPIDLKNIFGRDCKRFFIAAPAVDMKRLRLELVFDSEKRKARGELALRFEERNNPELVRYPYLYKEHRDYIKNRAYIQYEREIQDEIEKNNLDYYFDIKYENLATPMPRPVQRILYDPFICSLTPYGVLIHAKWGPEAEDATIKRYEQLRDAVIGEGGAV